MKKIFVILTTCVAVLAISLVGVVGTAQGAAYKPGTAGVSTGSEYSFRATPRDLPLEEVVAIAPTPTPAATAATSSKIPTLEAFTAQLRQEGSLGLWAEGYFAYRFYSATWGVVPGASQTASYSGFESYRAFFIHNYLGGNKLYSVRPGTRVAVIWSDRIEWFQISGVYRFEGTSTGTDCNSKEPYTSWDGGAGPYTAYDIISNYYNQPFAIQTCICSEGRVGLYILTGQSA